MAFDNTVLTQHADLMAGEVLKSKPHNVEAFELFADGLVEGRFCRFDTADNTIKNLSGTQTPTLAGIVRRKPTGEIGLGVYSTSGPEIDSVAEVINFGWATVTVTDAADPSKYDQVYTVNDDTADAGKATNDAGETEVPGAVFWEEKQDGVWLVRVMMGVESTISLYSAFPALEIESTDNGDETATVTIQAVDINGDALAANVLTRVWVGGADDFGSDAITDIAVDDGTVKEIVAAEEENLLITDDTGLITLVLTMTSGTDTGGTTYLWAELGGNIYAAGEIVITGASS